ncbi:hypothetical protein FDX20_32110, partial [Citrobacter sp. TBCS-11]
MQGVLLALVPMFAWGSIGFVANKFGGDAKQQTLGMTLGYLCGPGRDDWRSIAV